VVPSEGRDVKETAKDGSCVENQEPAQYRNLPINLQQQERKESRPMRKSLHIFTLALVLLSVSAAAIAAEPAAANGVTGVVNINTADASQLALLPRIGEKAAQRIIEYRTQHGPFKKATDLMQVKGVGAKTFEGLSSWIAVDGKTTLSGKVRTARKPSAQKPATATSN
jgi:competence protein ComEA